LTSLKWGKIVPELVTEDIKKMKNYINFQIGRYNRIQKMSFPQIASKLRQKLEEVFSLRRNIRRLAFLLDKLSISFYEDNYQERPEVGAVNFEVKTQRQTAGGYFEQPLIVLLNRGVTSLIEENEKSILEIGSGTGLFAYETAKDLTRKIVASEFNNGAREWSMSHRSRNNIQYCQYPLSKFSCDEFDLVVTIEVIEHLDNYSSFLNDLSLVAPTLIVTTPNKNRSPFDSIENTPMYGEHCREWTAGEFYWVLRCFFDQVDLYTIPDLKKQINNLKLNNTYIPQVSGCGILTKEHILIARCQRPSRLLSNGVSASKYKHGDL